MSHPDKELVNGTCEKFGIVEAMEDSEKSSGG